MAICMMCGNDYAKPIKVIYGGESYIFDCFECAISQLAPHCAQCNCKILGHGIESQDDYYCCAHCARAAGRVEAKDHV